MKIGILTTFSDEILGYLPYTTTINSRYAANHGYDYILRRSRVGDRSHHWSKIEEAKEYIMQYDYLWVLDADCIIQDVRPTIESFAKMAPNTMLLICDDAPNGGHINTGSMILKGGDPTWKFLSEWWREGKKLDKLHTKFHEQDTLWAMIEAGKIKQNRDYTLFSATAFNSVYGKIKDKDFVAHVMADPIPEKIKQLRHIYKKLI